MEREDAMRAFRGGECPILIATGVAARGIDVHNVNHVINYDLPSVDHGGIEEYVHRIGIVPHLSLLFVILHDLLFTNVYFRSTGRTGRIGHRGLATSFYTDRDEPLASVLTRTLLETKQPIPDFFELYVPEGEARENLKFEADSDYEECPAGGGDDGWGGGGGDANGDSWGNAGDGSNDTWGSNAATTTDAWGADTNANATTTVEAGSEDKGKANDSWGAGAAAASW